MFGLQEAQNAIMSEFSGNDSDLSTYSQTSSAQDVTSSEFLSQSEADLPFYPSSGHSSGYSSAAEHSVLPHDILNQAFTEMSSYTSQTYPTSSTMGIPNYFDPMAFPAEDSMNSCTSPNTSFDNSYQSFVDVSTMSDSGQSTQSSTKRESKHCGRPKSNAQSNKPKRKRIINKNQRGAANVRERKRMVTLNDAFEILKTKIPQKEDKKMSRIDTLRTAITYITNMQAMVQQTDRQAAAAYMTQGQQHYPSYPHNTHGPINNASYCS